MLFNMLLAQVEEPSLSWEVIAIVSAVVAGVISFFYSRAVKD